MATNHNTRTEIKNEILQNIEFTFSQNNSDLILKRDNLVKRIAELQDELEDLKTVLLSRKRKISLTKALKHLSNNEINMLKTICLSQTKKEIYRKAFTNADPFDPESWSIIELLEQLQLVEVVRDPSSFSVMQINSFVSINDIVV